MYGGDHHPCMNLIAPKHGRPSLFSGAKSTAKDAIAYLIGSVAEGNLTSVSALRPLHGAGGIAQEVHCRSELSASLAQDSSCLHYHILSLPDQHMHIVDSGREQMMG